MAARRLLLAALLVALAAAAAGKGVETNPKIVAIQQELQGLRGELKRLTVGSSATGMAQTAANSRLIESTQTQIKQLRAELQTLKQKHANNAPVMEGHKKAAATAKLQAKLAKQELARQQRQFKLEKEKLRLKKEKERGRKLKLREKRRKEQDNRKHRRIMRKIKQQNDKAARRERRQERAEKRRERGARRRAAAERNSKKQAAEQTKKQQLQAKAQGKQEKRSKKAAADQAKHYGKQMTEVRKKADRRESRRKKHARQEQAARRRARTRRAKARAEARKERSQKRGDRARENGRKKRESNDERSTKSKEHHRKDLEINSQNNNRLFRILSDNQEERRKQLATLVAMAQRCSACSGDACTSCPPKGRMVQMLNDAGYTGPLTQGGSTTGPASESQSESSTSGSGESSTSGKGRKERVAKARKHKERSAKARKERIAKANKRKAERRRKGERARKGNEKAVKAGGKTGEKAYKADKKRQEKAHKRKARFEAERRRKGERAGKAGGEVERRWKRDDKARARKEAEAKKRKGEKGRKEFASKQTSDTARRAEHKLKQSIKRREARDKLREKQQEDKSKEHQQKQGSHDQAAEQKAKFDAQAELRRKSDAVTAERRYKTGKVGKERAAKKAAHKKAEAQYKEYATKKRDKRSERIKKILKERREKYLQLERNQKASEAARKKAREEAAKATYNEHKAKAQKLGEKAIKAEDKEKKDEDASKKRTEANYKEKQTKRMGEYAQKRKGREQYIKSERKLKADQAKRERGLKQGSETHQKSVSERKAKIHANEKEFEEKEIHRRRHARELQRKKEGKDAIFAEHRTKKHHERVEKKDREVELKLAAASTERQAKLREKWAEEDRKSFEAREQRKKAARAKRREKRHKAEAKRKHQREQLAKKQQETRQKQEVERTTKDTEERAVKASHSAEQRNKIKVKYEEMMKKQAEEASQKLKEKQNKHEAHVKDLERQRERRKETRHKAEEKSKQERETKWKERETKFNERSDKLNERQSKQEQEAAQKVESKHKHDYAERRTKQAEAQRERKAKEETAKQEALEGSPITLLNGWRYYGAPYGKPVYFIAGDLCVLSGLITTDSVNPVITVLPMECRPKDGTHIFSARIVDNHIRIDVAINGQVSIVWSNSGPGWLTLNGISFAINDRSVVPSQLQNGWTPYANGFAPPTVREAGGLCIFSGLGRAGSWGQLMQIPEGCKPWDGQIIFSGNNHNANTRWDITTQGWIARAGGQTSYGWSSFDGMFWFGKDLHGTAVDLNSGFENYSHGFRFAKYARVGRLCVLSGLIRKSGSNIHALTLPKECRPRRKIIVSGSNADTWKVRIDIDVDGSVTLPGGWFGADWFSLSGIHFVVQGNPAHDDYVKAVEAKKRIVAEAKARLQKYLAQHPETAKQYDLAMGKQIPLSNGWKAFEHEDHMVPSYRIVNGICLLSGVASHHSNAQGLVGQLPPECRPRGGRLVFQTLKGGKAARVDVLPDGQIHLVASDAWNQWLTFDGIRFHINDETLEGVMITGSYRPFGQGYRRPLVNSVQIGDKNSVCLASGLLTGSAGHVGQVPPECRSNKGRLIFSVSNHEQVTRMDLESGSGNIIVSGGFQRFNWRPLDGMMWSVNDGELLSLRNGWNNYAGGYTPATVTKVGELCVLSGLIRNGDFHAGMITVLPAYCRPAKRLAFAVNIHDYDAHVNVMSNGEVLWVSGRQYDWISLSNIAFVASPSISVTGSNPWEETIKCSQFWKNGGEGCPTTWRPNAAAGKQDCNPFLSNCREKCCVPKLITCNTFYAAADGGCPAGFRNHGNAGGQQCYDTPNGGDACRNRCCQYIHPGWGGKCTYWGDPHVISFDANNYDCYNNNEYQMLSNPQFDEAVHVIQRKSPKREFQHVPAFVQGIALRSKQDIFSIQMIDAHEIFKLELRFNGRLIPYPERREILGDFALEPTGGRLPDPYAHWNDAGWANTYFGIVNRRTGTSAHVRWYHGGWFRYGEAHVVLPRPYLPTHGICGNWDGNRGNDLVFRGSNSACGSWNSDACCRTWMIPLAQSYFHRAPHGKTNDKQASIEQICGNSEALKDATKLCKTRPAQYRDSCIVEMCGGNNAAVVNQNLNVVQTGRP